MKDGMGIFGMVATMVWGFSAATLPGQGDELRLQGMTVGPSMVQLSVAYPEGFTNHCDVLVTTNLAGAWSIRVTNAPPLPVMEVPPPALPSGGALFVLLADRDLDRDADGLSDAGERLVYGTDPLNPDTDGDGYPDGAELGRGTDPLVPGSHAAVIYADSVVGDDRCDGYAAGRAGAHGPKLTLPAAERAAVSGDEIRIQGTLPFSGTWPDLGGKTLTWVAVGAVLVCP